MQPTALATEGEGQQYTTTTTSHTPRWPAPSAPHGPAQPPFASAIASSASNQVAPSSSANAAAAPRQRPGRLADLQPAMPPPPHPLGSTSSTSRLEPGGHVGLDGTIVSRQRRQLRLPGTDLATELDGLSFFLPNHQSSSLPPHPLPFSGPILWMFRPSSLPPPHTLPLSGLHQQSRRVSPPCTICSCVMKHDR